MTTSLSNVSNSIILEFRATVVDATSAMQRKTYGATYEVARGESDPFAIDHEYVRGEPLAYRLKLGQTYRVDVVAIKEPESRGRLPLRRETIKSGDDLPDGGYTFDAKCHPSLRSDEKVTQLGVWTDGLMMTEKLALNGKSALKQGSWYRVSLHPVSALAE